MDEKTKTWVVKSDPSADLRFQGIDFSDCVGRKADPSKYKEVDGPKAHTIIESD